MKLIFNSKYKDKIPKIPFLNILKKLPVIVDGVTEKEVELLLTDDEEIRKLNFTFRGIDKTTDVLSFAERETEIYDGTSLGQIIISVDRAKEQANELKQSMEEELKFLFTHGLLHILGFDHQYKKDEKIMLDKAYKLLDRI